MTANQAQHNFSAFAYSRTNDSALRLLPITIRLLREDTARRGAIWTGLPDTEIGDRGRCF